MNKQYQLYQNNNPLGPKHPTWKGAAWDAVQRDLAYWNQAKLCHIREFEIREVWRNNGNR